MILKDRKNRNAFTLVELLVVLAILGLLAALLLPSLGRAQRQAQLVKCGMNLRQLGLAVQMYVTDHNGRYLHAEPNGWLLGGKSGTFYRHKPETRVLNNYVGHQYELFRCPGDRGANGNMIYSEKLQSSFYDGIGSSYLYNDKMRLPAPPRCGLWRSWNRTPVRDTQIRNPSRLVVYGDPDIRAQRYPPTAAVWWHTSTPENLRANVVFVDGHVSYVQVVDYDQPAEYDLWHNP